MIEQIDFDETNVYISAAPVNMNKSFDGLAVLVQEALGRLPYPNEMFVFYNSPRDKIKLLVWDGNGFIILYKRLERGKLNFKRYQARDGSISMTSRLIRQLLVGAKVEQGKLKRWSLFDGHYVV